MARETESRRVLTLAPHGALHKQHSALGRGKAPPALIAACRRAVVSEAIRCTVDGIHSALAAVLKWLDAQAPQTLFVTTINLAEMRAGIEVLSAGRRRAALELAMSKQVLTLFAGRILSFDTPAAFAFAVVFAGAQSQGNPIGFADCAVAAIANATDLQ